MKKNSKKKSNIKKSDSFSIIFFRNIFSSAELFAILNVFSTMQQIYKLINFWILNESSDIYVCNDFKRFHLKRITSEKNIIIVEKIIHQIKTFEIVDIIAKNFRKLILIKLLYVILIIDYFINIVYLNCFEDKNIFHDLKNDRLQRKNKTFCYVKKMSRHKILKYSFSQNFQADETSKIFASSLIFSQILKTIKTDWHNIFDHPNFEILFNFEKTIKNIKIITSESVSIINLCEICAFIKTHKLIFKRFDHDKSVNAFFEKTKFDLIQQISDYNENNWINHFTCFHIKAEFVYTHFKKNDCLKIIKSFLHMIKTRYNQIVRFFRMNDESILNEKFNLIIETYEITAKRTAFYTSDQNEKIERSEKILIIKTKIMQISNYLSENLWSEIYKIDDYINNRILKRNLKWLTLYETLFEKKFNLFHLHLYDCRAYFFRQKIFKKNKLKSRAIINYFVDYDSINIFRIWMLSKTKMIKTKNVNFWSFKILRYYQIEFSSHFYFFNKIKCWNVKFIENAINI